MLPTFSARLKYHHPSSPGKRRLGSAALVDRLLAQNHPDKVAHLDPDLRDLAERKIRAIIEAYEARNLDELLTLADPELDQCVRPYLVTRRWVREKYAEWGPGHPLWEARVLGQFPTQAEDALISLAWLEEAAQGSIEAGRIRGGWGRAARGRRG